MQLTPKDEKIYWTRHIKNKMRYYRLSENRIKRVMRNPDRKELGMAVRTMAVMQTTGTKKHPTEIWVMYQKTDKKQKKKLIKMISAWRYPGISPEREPPPIPEDTLWELERLNKSSEVPEEYKKGFVTFLNCKIDLSKKVFIPRIETEFWVKKAIKDIKHRTPNTEHQTEILDIFAGSGCIGIAILKSVKNSFVHFIDIDKKAIEQIKINLKLNKISNKRYRIYKSNFFEKLKEKRYNFIFANPPYAAIERIKEIEPSVLKYEPKEAFLSDKKGLYHIKRFLKDARKFLNKEGVIYLEFDPKQKEEIKNILKAHQCKDFEFFKDQFEKYRFLKIENPD